jgi:hypothetical protein
MSMYLFSKKSKFRIFFYRCKVSKFFEPAVQTLILLSSIKLGVDTYYSQMPPESIEQRVSLIIDTILNILFFFEMMVKMIAMGIVMDDGSYLRESWNRLDCFIVMTSIVDMSATSYDIAIVKIFRVLRVLRPLRFINHNVNLKMVVVALLESMNSIFNVVIVIAVVYLIFAILGVSFFGGRFFYCNIDMYTIQTEQDCMINLGEWKQFDFNFDDVKQAMMTLYVVASLEGWPDIMIQALDMTEQGQGPRKENTLASMVFFIVFILIGSFFFLNFFLGVLFLKFEEAQKEEQKGFSKEDLTWQDIQKLIVQAKPEYESTNVPTLPWRIYFHEMVTSKRFEMVITIAIMLNMVQMALQHEGQTPPFTRFMDFTNDIFTLIFIGEAVCKIIAYGKSYFHNTWNQFDFFVVVSSIFDILLKAIEQLVTTGAFLKAAPQIARVFRVLRVLRVVRLASKAEGLQAILQTISFSITPLSNVILLLLLIFFMFAVLGNFLFSTIKYGDVMDEIVNFETFDKAFFLLFAISTGENWPIIMFDCSRTKEEGCIEGETCGNSTWSFLYFFMMVLICSYVMLNLFVLVII